MVHRQIHIKL